MEQAALLRASGRPDAALALLDAAALVFDRHHLSIRQHQGRLLQAECYRDLAQANRAARLYEMVLSAPSDQPLSPALTYRAHYGLGQVAEQQGQRETARQHYQAAVADVEILRRGLRVDEFKASFLDDKLMLYQAAARLSLEMGQINDAFGYVERAKSSALLDWLARDLEVRAEGDPQVWARLKALKEAWWWHYNKAHGPPLDETARGSADAAQAWDALSHVEAQINHVVRQIQGTAEVSGDDDKEAHAWTKVRDGLEADTVLVEYFCLGDEILAFVLPGDRPLTVCRDFAYSLREVRRSLRALNLSLKGLHSLDPAYVRDVLTPLALRHLAWLDQALLAPLAPWIADCRKLVIVPHDVLYYLPFHAFYDGARYLIERSEVHYAPSAGVLAQCHQLQQRRRLANPEGAPVDLVMGHSDGGRLHHIQGEVEAVAAHLPGALRLEEAAATLAQLRQQTGACRLLHLASHAAFRADNPLFSFIQLADAPLNVIDLYHLNLDAALVTLSACETGMSQPKGGDLFGLARGCLHAGAPALVASLWQVDDASTARLMDTFYARLAAGATVASALRAAQLALLHTDPGSPSAHYAHPHYWAPFFLMGADGAPCSTIE
jgi:tetratricopeptide (TPR) repeat protein